MARDPDKRGPDKRGLTVAENIIICAEYLWTYSIEYLVYNYNSILLPIPLLLPVLGLENAKSLSAVLGSVHHKTCTSKYPKSNLVNT